MIVLAAAVIAVAFVPVLFAYLQLGYAADVEANEGYGSPIADGKRVLQGAVTNASDESPRYDWRNRRFAVDRFKAHVRPAVDTLESSRVEDGVVYQAASNDSAASTVATSDCPGGPNRQFGSCDAIDGVVVQDRLGETHVVAAAFDVTITTQRGRTEVTLVIRTVPS